MVKVSIMNISRILDEIDPSYGGAWSNCRDLMRQNSNEWTRVKELMNDIKIYGVQEPGVLYHDLETSEIILTNGTHRFIACWELGHEDFPVIEQDFTRNYWNDEFEVNKMTTVNFLLNDLDYHFTNVADELFDFIMSRMSFRLTRQHWVECDIVSSQASQGSLEVSVGLAPVPDELIIQLRKRMLERLSSQIPSKSILDFTISQEYSFNK